MSAKRARNNKFEAARTCSGYGKVVTISHKLLKFSNAMSTITSLGINITSFALKNMTFRFNRSWKMYVKVPVRSRWDNTSHQTIITGYVTATGESIISIYERAPPVTSNP